MRVVIQRTKSASVTIDWELKSKINEWMMILVWIEDSDTEEDISRLSSKIVNLRIFDDSSWVMNLSIKENWWDILLVSQFTLFANTKKWNRPSYLRSSKPDFAIPMYEKLIKQLEKDLEKPIQTWEFWADMQVELINNWPVTIIIDSKTKE